MFAALDFAISFLKASNSLFNLADVDVSLIGVLEFPKIAAMRNNAGWIGFSWSEVFIAWLI